MKILVYFVILAFSQSAVGQNYLNYLCKSYDDYSNTRADNSNCYYSTDVLNSFEAIAWSYGYNVQAFEVITEDQYILTVFRIFPKGKTRKLGSPILLQHGSSLSSTAFMLFGNHSLAFILADEGYDVWLGNLRGTTYSSRHRYLNLNSKKYWDFSFHEQGIYDVKAFVDVVTSETKQKVIYIGYSIGTRVYNVYNSIRPKEARDKLRVAISLAPTSFIHHNKSPIFKETSLIPYRIMKVALNLLFPRGVFQLKTYQSTKKILHTCLDSPARVTLCNTIQNLVSGFNFDKEVPDSFPILLGQSMQPTSLKVFYHTQQSIRNKGFRQYDHGIVKNLINYGRTKPPIYDLSKITVPNFFFYGAGDFLATEKGVMELYEKLPQEAKPFGKPYKIKDEKFAHNNFIIHRDVKALVYDHIVRFLREENFYFNN